MTEQEVKDILQWDVVNWSKGLRFWEKHVSFDNRQAGLELGGREGGLSLWMAQHGLEVVCSDIQSVEETARPLHEQYGVTERIRYEAIDATAIPYENAFDVIAFKSILGGIGRDTDNPVSVHAQVIDQIYRALKPGGVLLFMENLAGSGLHRFARKQFVRWGDSWQYLTLAEMEQHLTRFDSYTIRSNGFLGAFGRGAQLRHIFGTFDRHMFDALIPPRGRYISYGMATKKSTENA